MIFLLIVTALIFSLLQLSDRTHFTGAGVAFAQEDWKTELDYVCSKTQDAMNLSSEELKGLVARCDNLKPLIEKLNGPVKKVSLRKLKKCKDLFLWKGTL
jgi:hypothetical protein